MHAGSRAVTIGSSICVIINSDRMLWCLCPYRSPIINTAMERPTVEQQWHYWKEQIYPASFKWRLIVWILFSKTCRNGYVVQSSVLHNMAEYKHGQMDWLSSSNFKWYNQKSSPVWTDREYSQTNVIHFLHLLISFFIMERYWHIYVNHPS